MGAVSKIPDNLRNEGFAVAQSEGTVIRRSSGRRAGRSALPLVTLFKVRKQRQTDPGTPLTSSVLLSGGFKSTPF